MPEEEQFKWDESAPVEEAPAPESEAEPVVEAAQPAEAEPPAEPAAAEAAPPAAESTRKWFIIHTYSGFENKVAESLKSRSEAFGFADKVGQILIPTEEVVELRGGRKVTSKRMIYPGYVLVELDMDDDLWHAVKNTPRVTGFVGGGTAPVPLTADEVNSILYRQASSADRPRPAMTFEKNESVRIVDGPFANFSGKVDEVNAGAWQHAAGAGDDFRPRHSGRARFLTGRKNVKGFYGKEDNRLRQIADSGWKGHSGGLRSGRRSVRRASTSWIFARPSTPRRRRKTRRA